ncbi:hypothetical protein [Microbacterium hydrocarbonoxydans]|uniref:hypothetical protein n=1 Tax=Microbacterium hydrocarbonoxydans TaxID=273678 RepID=UPI0013DC4B2E|nr:hypothetical protein [Microbacterium hydrocarbonoxydans]
MFEHPYFTDQVARVELQQMERRAACRRFLAEHADQIVARPGLVSRLLRLLVPSSARAVADTRGAAVCEPAVAR